MKIQDDTRKLALLGSVGLNKRRGRIASEGRAEFLRALDQFKIEIVFPQDGERRMGLSGKYRPSVCEAAYLTLPRREQLPLATLDPALAAAASAEGIPSLD